MKLTNDSYNNVINRIDDSIENIVKMASTFVSEKYYEGKKVSNAIKVQRLYQLRLREAILMIKELVDANNKLCESYPS